MKNQKSEEIIIEQLHADLSLTVFEEESAFVKYIVITDERGSRHYLEKQNAEKFIEAIKYFCPEIYKPINP